MKKILSVIILSIVLVSCYEDYIEDHVFSAVYFTRQVDVRTVVVGEGLQFKIGVGLGGVMRNTIDRSIGFSLDNALITAQVLNDMKSSSETYIKNAVAGVSALQPMPSGYYTLSNSNTIVIKSGQHYGAVTLKVDSATFLADPETIRATYAIPLNITTAEADSILEPLKYSVIGIKYENMLFGNYLHGGVTTVRDASGNTVQTIVYPTAINQTDDQIWTLTTTAPDALATNGYSNKTSKTKKELQLTLSGGTITVGTATGSTNTYEADGESTYNQAKLLQNRKIVLRYRYTSGANTYYCQDTLTFRNRIRDGVNEWQDENPSHYLK